MSENNINNKENKNIKPKFSRFIQSNYADYKRVAPTFFDPRYTSTTYAIPSDQRTLYGLYRFFAETDPIVGSAIKIHSELPISGASLKPCEDDFINRHYEEMWHKIGGIKLLEDIISEYYEIGDVFLFGSFNVEDYMWDQFVILNPDYVKVETVWINKIPLIKLIPDENLKRIVKTRSPKFLYEQLPNDIINYVRFAQEIPLDPEHVFHLSHAKRPYETRGRSLIKRILKLLLLEDKLNQANFAIASRHVVPVTVIKVGDPNLGYIPSEEELEAVREMFANYELDPNFAIIYHWGLNIEYYGSNGRMLPISPELERIYRLKFIGLQIHEQLMAGVGGSYAQAFVNLDVMRQRYLSLQIRLYNFIENIFRSVADYCGFYKTEDVFSSSGYTGKRHGKERDKKLSAILSDYNNPDFKKFYQKKYGQVYNRKQRVYVYPHIDWGSYNAARDESLKSYIMWLVTQRPWLVDDATLLHLANLDRDEQIENYIKDVERDKKLKERLERLGLLEYAKARTQQAPFNNLPTFMPGGGPMMETPGGVNIIGDELGQSFVPSDIPQAPVGENYQSEYQNLEPPENMESMSSILSNLEKEILKEVTEDDRFISSEIMENKNVS